MIFIGGVQPKTRRLSSTARVCPSCGAPTAELKRTDHYISLFFIPIIRISTGTPFLACKACGGLFDESGEPMRPPGRVGSVCPNCGERTDPSFTFCPQCGGRL